MCGIAGYFHKNEKKIDKTVFEAMTRTLVHRGPDEEGYFAEAFRFQWSLPLGILRLQP